MSDSLTMFKKLQEGGQPCSAWTISFIKEQSVWTSKAFYLKSPTYKAPTSKKELGFYTVPFKSSVHNWASLMVFEKNSDFFFFFRKEKQELFGPWGGIFLFFQPGVKPFQAEFRMICIHEEKAADGHRRVTQGLSLVLVQFSTCTPSLGHCAGPQGSKTVKTKCCLPGAHDEHSPDLIFWKKIFLPGEPFLTWLTTEKVILKTGVCQAWLCGWALQNAHDDILAILARCQTLY